MKKAVALVSSTVLATMSIVGCGANSKQEAPKASTPEQKKEVEANTDTASATTSDVEIWYYWETEGHQQALDHIIQEYNTSQSEVKAVAKYVPFADFKKQLSIGASADQLPDVVIIDAPDHASYATMGIFADVTDKIDVSNYYDGPIASCTLDNTLYGIPFGSNCLSLYYNVEMLESAGLNPPTTWDELKETAAKLTQENVTGLAFSSVQNEEGTFNFMPWVWSTGASSFELGTEKGIRALQLAKDLVDSGAMSKEVINWTQGDVMNQFISGNVAMMVNGPWQIPTMKAEAPDLKWGVTLIPKDSEYASVLGGENFAVIAGGNEGGALSFLEYATNEESVKYLMNAFGYIAARSDVAEKQFAADDIMTKFTEQMKYAQPRGPHAEWPTISDAISLSFNEVITGAATPAEAAEKAQKTIDDIVK